MYVTLERSDKAGPTIVWVRAAVGSSNPGEIGQEKDLEIKLTFFQKFREYVLNSNRMSRLQAKYDHIRVTLGDQATLPHEGNYTLTRRQNTSRRYIWNKLALTIADQVVTESSTLANIIK